MKQNGFRQLGDASQDPAVTFLLLLPLAVLHLSGWRLAQSGAFSFVERTLNWAGSISYWFLGISLFLTLLWAVGRIRLESLPWRGGASLIIAEGIFWGVALGPLLSWLSAMVPIQALSVIPFHLGFESSLHGNLALAAGAGLYEELLFRAGLMGGLYVLLRGLFQTVGWRESGMVLAMGISLLISSALFSWAHTLGDPLAPVGSELIYRFLAGTVLGCLYAWRGLAIVAWAHASYDALLLL